MPPIDINSIKYIPDLPGAKSLTDGDLMHLNQQAVDVKVSLSTLAAFINDKCHPIGSLIEYGDKNKDPNVDFPGQTWVRLGSGLSLRTAAVNDSNLGTTEGADTMTLSVDSLPAHSHARGTLAISSGGRHSHGGAISQGGRHSHTGRIAEAGYHSHGASSAGAGGHDHEYVGDDNLGRDGGAIQTGRQAGRYDADSDRDRWANYYKVSYVGDHAHAISINGDGAHVHNMTIDEVGDHVHGLSIYDGGDHTHGITGDISSTGNGREFSLLNRVIYVAVWKRTK